MKKLSHKELIYNLKDIGLELQDNSFYYDVSNIQYTQSLFVTVNIHNRGKHFKGSLVSDVMERLFFFMKDQGWRLWLDIHIYNDNHLQYDMSRVCLQREYDYYFDLFRNKLESGSKGDDCIKSVKLRFDTWNYDYK